MSRKKKRIGYVNSSVKWKFDFDYLSKLSPEEKQWLMRFVQEYINGYPAKDPLHSDMKENYRAKNAANRDIYNKETKVPYEE